MSQDEQERGAAWVRQRFTELLREHDAADRHRGWHLMSPQDAGGEYFDRDLWVLTINIAGQMQRLTIPAEDMEDLETTSGIRDRIEQGLAALAAKAHASAGLPIKKRDSP